MWQRSSAVPTIKSSATPGAVHDRQRRRPGGASRSHDDPTQAPIGIQTFREIREDGCYYVDKTAHIRRLLDEGKHYFLSRPRRFGKSLFLDTCKELFEGSEALFEGLAVTTDGTGPCAIRSCGSASAAGASRRPATCRRARGSSSPPSNDAWRSSPNAARKPGRLASLLEALHERTGQRVAVLVDEYDKPILDALEAPEVARANRDYLRGLYAVIKDSDAHIRFSFLTGVSKFSKVNLFSGLNNLTDITLDPRYSAICGYADADLDTVFAPELPGLDRDAIREWYNGYWWLGEEKVYNPSTSCCCSATASSAPGGSRPGRRRSSSRRCSSAA